MRVLSRVDADGHMSPTLLMHHQKYARTLQTSAKLYEAFDAPVGRVTDAMTSEKDKTLLLEAFVEEAKRNAVVEAEAFATIYNQILNDRTDLRKLIDNANVEHDKGLQQVHAALNALEAEDNLTEETVQNFIRNAGAGVLTMKTVREKLIHDTYIRPPLHSYSATLHRGISTSSTDPTMATLYTRPSSFPMSTAGSYNSETLFRSPPRAAAGPPLRATFQTHQDAAASVPVFASVRSPKSAGYQTGMGSGNSGSAPLASGSSFHRSAPSVKQQAGSVNPVSAPSAYASTHVQVRASDIGLSPQNTDAAASSRLDASVGLPDQSAQLQNQIRTLENQIVEAEANIKRRNLAADASGHEDVTAYLQTTSTLLQSAKANIKMGKDESLSFNDRSEAVVRADTAVKELLKEVQYAPIEDGTF